VAASVRLCFTIEQRINVQAGRGGDGVCTSVVRSSPQGWPRRGDGGPGGDVVLVADPDLRESLRVSREAALQGRSGEPGRGA